MPRPSSGGRAALAACLALASASPLTAQFRGELVAAAQADPARLGGTGAVVLSLAGPEDLSAARRIQAAGLTLYYWIEIGRNPALAEAHPEWMASLQGHPEWRRHFPNVGLPQPGEVVKNFPWVPVHYREAFDAHLGRVAALLKDLPAPAGIFLNDLQAAPSACGCGNGQCRWTADYGPIRTATRLGADAAARFVSAVAQLARGARIIPVWLTECEEHDKPERCAGVACYTGLCWKEYAAQLELLARQAETLAVLAPYRLFDRDPAWVGKAVRTFGAGVAPARLIAVLQGWDLGTAEVEAQIERARQAGAGGYLVARMKIDQSWDPRIVPRIVPVTR